jgi:hypothetical protein
MIWNLPSSWEVSSSECCRETCFSLLDSPKEHVSSSGFGVLPASKISIASFVSMAFSRKALEDFESSDSPEAGVELDGNTPEVVARLD